MEICYCCDEPIKFDKNNKPMRIINRDTKLVLCFNCNFWLYNYDNRKNTEEKKKTRHKKMDNLECYACGGKYILPNGRPQWRFNQGTPYVLCPACFNWIEQMDDKYYNKEKRQIEQSIRRCYCCNKVGIAAERCYYNYPTDLLLCNLCYNRLFLNDYKNHYRKTKQLNKFRINLCGNQIWLGFDPRIGVCTWCRKIALIDCKRTALHHDMNQYDLRNPLRFTIELCGSCHRIETARLKRLGIKATIYY